MMGGDAGLAWPDFPALGVTAHISFGRGPIYRGRPNQARALVLADQESHDDLFTGRAMTGDGGQHFQEFLRAVGFVESYLILRVLPVDTLDLTAAAVGALVDHPQVRTVYRAIVEHVRGLGNTSMVLTVGPHAKRLAPHVGVGGLPVVELPAWKESRSLEQWQNALQTLQGIPYQKDLPTPTFAYDGHRGQIPRVDLPYGTLRWMGSSGDRGVRAVVSGKPSPHYYKILMPEWAFQLGAEPLSAEEQQAIQGAP